MKDVLRSAADIASLNPEQRLVVETTDTPCCVVSIPGSGKTKTITEKIVHLLTGHERGFWVKPKSVMAVTFTAEAGKELTERASKKLNDEAKSRLRTGTFHSLFMQALKRVGAKLTSRRLASTGQSQQYLDRSLEQCFPTEWALAKRESDKNNMRSKVDRCRSLLDDPYGLKSAGKDASKIKAAQDLAETVRIYKEMMKDAGLMDFGMILEESLVFLETQGVIERTKEYQDFKDSHQQQFGYKLGWIDEFTNFLGAGNMLVDEAQDLDEIQLGIVLSIASQNVIIDLVGDDDQSIYAFRSGLGYGGMKRFQRATVAKEIFLENNYRCKTEILRLADGIIAQNDIKKRHDKTLVAVRGPGGDVTLDCFENGNNMLDVAARTIKDVQNNSKSSGKQSPTMAVIARVNKLLDVAEKELIEKNVPYERLGGASIWGENPVCFLIGLLDGFIHRGNQSAIDQCLYWADVRPINGIYAGIDKEIMAKMDKTVAECKALVWSTGNDSVQKLISKAYHWFAWVISVKGWGEKRRLFYTSRLRLAVELLGGTQAVREGELGIKGNPARKAKPDEELDRIGIRGTLDERLKTIQRLDKTGKSEPGTVKLVSMHGSKGLEFEHVWLIGLDDKTMPGGLKEHEVKEEGMDAWLENQEEERRLLYVGITRAKDVLHLSWARIPPISIVDMNDDNKKTSKPKPPSSECRFLINLPANLRPRESRSQSLNTKIGVETM